MCKNGKSQKFHNKIVLVLLIGLFLTGGLIGCSDKSAPTDASPASEVESKISIVSKELSTESNTSPKTSESQPETESNNLDSSITSEITTEPESEHRTDEKIIGISNKDISDLNVKFYENVENDTSGRWRLAEISEDVDIQNYIYSYYKEYFKDDSEFHVIVNHSRKVTTSINPVHEALYVVEHNYVEDEKHDAKRLCAKPVIKEYYIHTDNGDIENLESTLDSSITSEIATEPESELESSIASETTTESESEIFSTEVEHRTGAEIIGISEKDISDISLEYYDSVNNDVTGRWRLAKTSADVDIQDYIFSYYKTYYKNDNEIHGIVNRYKKITTRLNYFDGMLFVTELTYVDGEEHNAKLLFSGTPIKSYIVYTDNGDIAKDEEE